MLQVKSRSIVAAAAALQNIYGDDVPPSYPLHSITTPLAIFTGPWAALTRDLIQGP
jgi:hypothetical protein